MTQQSMLLSIEQVNKSYGKNQVLSDISLIFTKEKFAALWVKMVLERQR